MLDSTAKVENHPAQHKEREDGGERGCCLPSHMHKLAYQHNTRKGKTEEERGCCLPCTYAQACIPAQHKEREDGGGKGLLPSMHICTSLHTSTTQGKGRRRRKEIAAFHAHIHKLVYQHNTRKGKTEEERDCCLPCTYTQACIPAQHKEREDGGGKRLLPSMHIYTSLYIDTDLQSCILKCKNHKN